MFDISFTEILVIAAVALVVIGPERLPKVARTLGHLFGRAQRYVNDVKNDIQREMELEELKNWKTSVEGTGRSIENTVRTEMNQFQEELNRETKSSTAVPPAPSSEAAGEAAPPLDSPSDSFVPPIQPITPSVKSKAGPNATGAEVPRD
ncbi:Sec-independent protein translocase protein TatB [Nitrosovibrio sp. Nv6]|uniref:Sec-independent protein translocase protein TatB n=1 Tax=Nitrosovibrio sp. Nv6 TaxID=1855340 RepID=UPI0008C4678C|nr:Sec-independent protein translocase protein TatB [Nitrosovibrio sp. Nv6]SEP21580.1 sec-independent protein translocase protein TatB [Nitrosovibrio sp. Nv6]